MQELGREGKSHTAKPEGIPEKINQRQRVDMYRTVSTHPTWQPPGSYLVWEATGRRSYASCSLPLVSPNGELLPIPGQARPQRERASDLGPWLPGRVIEQAPLATAVV